MNSEKKNEGKTTMNNTRKYDGLSLRDMIQRLQPASDAGGCNVHLAAMQIIRHPDQAQDILNFFEKEQDLTSKETKEFLQNQPGFDEVRRQDLIANKITRTGEDELLLKHRGIETKAVFDSSDKRYVGYLTLSSQIVEFSGATEDELLKDFMDLADKVADEWLEKDARYKSLRLTVEEYEEMYDAYVELIKSTPVPQYTTVGQATLIKEIVKELIRVRNRYGLRYEVLFQNIRLYCDEDNVFLPDIMIVPEGSCMDQRKVQDVPYLVIEVATKDTMMQDMVFKEMVYKSMGIPEYWVIILNTGSILRYVRGGQEGMAYCCQPAQLTLPVFEVPLRMSRIWKAVKTKGLLKKRTDPISIIDRRGKTDAEIRKELEFKAVLGYLTKSNLISMEEAAEAANMTLEEYNNNRTII